VACLTFCGGLGTDAIDFLGALAGRCVQLRDVDAAGLIIADQFRAFATSRATTRTAMQALAQRLKCSRASSPRVLPVARAVRSLRSPRTTSGL